MIAAHQQAWTGCENRRIVAIAANPTGGAIETPLQMPAGKEVPGPGQVPVYERICLFEIGRVGAGREPVAEASRLDAEILRVCWRGAQQNAENGKMQHARF